MVPRAAQTSNALTDHTLVVGRTQTGKTHWALSEAAGLNRSRRCPVLLFNADGFDLARVGIRAVRADWSTWPETMVRSLRAGDFVDFRASREDARAHVEANVLAAVLFAREWNPPVLYLVDEAQAWCNSRRFEGALFDLAARGLKVGIRCYYIAQRPAKLHNDIITQCHRHVIFQLSWEGRYLKSYGLPEADITARLARAGQHGYVIYDGINLTGPFGPEVKRNGRLVR